LFEIITGFLAGENNKDRLRPEKVTFMS